jgi:hypothetical protein
VEGKTEIYAGLEEVRKQIRDELIDQRYEQMIRELADKARMDVDERALKEILH